MKDLRLTLLQIKVNRMVWQPFCSSPFQLLNSLRVFYENSEALQSLRESDFTWAIESVAGSDDVH
jgi:hypothetical protein